jgi:hypothetical protein
MEQGMENGVKRYRETERRSDGETERWRERENG